MSKKFWVLILLAAMALGYFTHSPVAPSIQTLDSPVSSQTEAIPSPSPTPPPPSVRTIKTETGGSIQIRNETH